MRKILLIIALSFCGYAFAESQQLNQKPQTESKQQTQTPAKPVEEHGNEAGNEFWPPIFGYRVKVTDSLLVLFTFLLWLATRRLVIGGEETSKQQLRAYITLKQSALFAGEQNGIMIEPRRQIFIGCRPACELAFSNSGQTPAYDVEMIGTIGLVKWPINPADLDVIPIHAGRSKNIIGPAEIRSKWDITREDIPPLTANDIEGLLHGRLAIVVFGEVRYKNIFKEKCFLRYCYFTGGPTSLRGMTLAAHDEGNEADYTDRKPACRFKLTV